MAQPFHAFGHQQTFGAYGNPQPSHESGHGRTYAAYSNPQPQTPAAFANPHPLLSWRAAGSSQNPQAQAPDHHNSVPPTHGGRQHQRQRRRGGRGRGRKPRRDNNLQYDDALQEGTRRSPKRESSEPLSITPTVHQPSPSSAVDEAPNAACLRADYTRLLQEQITMGRRHITLLLEVNRLRAERSAATTEGGFLRHRLKRRLRRTTGSSEGGQGA
jgi:hypothetical protein